MLVIMYVEIFKTDIIVFIWYVINYGTDKAEILFMLGLNTNQSINNMRPIFIFIFG
jgi:hypothetical protein